MCSLRDFPAAEAVTDANEVAQVPPGEAAERLEAERVSRNWALNKARSEGRFRSYRISPDCLRLFLTRAEDWPNVLWFAQLDGVPSDASVESVSHDWASRSIRVMLCHQSFEVVPIGVEVPCGPGWLSVSNVALMRQEDGRYAVV